MNVQFKWIAQSKIGSLELHNEKRVKAFIVFQHSVLYSYIYLFVAFLTVPFPLIALHRRRQIFFDWPQFLYGGNSSFRSPMSCCQTLIIAVCFEDAHKGNVGPLVEIQSEHLPPHAIDPITFCLVHTAFVFVWFIAPLTLRRLRLSFFFAAINADTWLRD